MSAIETLSNQPAAQAIAWALLQFVWQGALVGLLTAIVLAALRNSAADVRYVVATIGLSLMITMPIVTAVQAWPAAEPLPEVVLTAQASTPTEAPIAAPVAAQSQVPNVWLGGDEGHGHLVADPAAAQVGIHDHGELVGGSVTGGPLYRAHHDGARVLHELIPNAAGGDGVVHVAN